jgi:hypothetical protein
MEEYKVDLKEIGRKGGGGRLTELDGSMQKPVAGFCQRSKAENIFDQL